MNNPGELVLSLVSYLSNQLPEIIALIAGVAVSLISWRRSARRAVLGLVAFVLALVGLLLSVGVVALSLWLQAGAGQPAAATAVVTGVSTFVVNLFPAAAWILILMALFGGKSRELTAQR